MIGNLCLTINILVDPPWYVRGNVLAGVDHAFNERTTETKLATAADPRRRVERSAVGGQNALDGVSDDGLRNPGDRCGR